LLSLPPLFVCVVLYVTNCLSTACEARDPDGQVDTHGIVASVLLGVFSFIVLWRLAQVKRLTKWSQQPPLPDNTRIQLFFRSHSDMQKLWVFFMLSCAVMLLAALATDRYLVEGRGYYARTVGAFAIANMGQMSWHARCGLEPTYSRKFHCSVAEAASVLVFVALLAALICILAALRTLRATHAAYMRIHARMMEAYRGQTLRVSNDPSHALLAREPVLLYQLATPATARWCSAASSLTIYAVLTYSMVVYTYVLGWYSYYPGHVDVSWILMLVVALCLCFADAFWKYQMKYALVPDYTVMETLPSVLRGETEPALRPQLLTDASPSSAVASPPGGVQINGWAQQQGGGHQVMSVSHAVAPYPSAYHGGVALAALSAPSAASSSTLSPSYASPSAPHPPPSFASGAEAGVIRFHPENGEPPYVEQGPPLYSAPSPQYNDLAYSSREGAAPDLRAGVTVAIPLATYATGLPLARPRFCPFCGTSLVHLPLEARFCGNCGKAVM
jgi:hypothetical protein